MPKTEALNKTKLTSGVLWSPIAAVLLVVAIYFGSQIAGALALYAYGLVGGKSTTEIEDWLGGSTVAQFANTVLVYGLMAFAVYWLAKKSKIPLRVLGVVPPRFKDVAIALMGVLPYIMIYGVLLAVMTKIFPSINVEQEQQLGFDSAQSSIGLALTFVSLVVLPPLVEELVMRGFLFTSLLKRYRFVVAVIVTSCIFAVAHLQIGSGAPLLWAAALDTFILSVVLCFMRYKTGSLWPGIILHALKNCVAFLSIFIFHLS